MEANFPVVCAITVLGLTLKCHACGFWMHKPCSNIKDSLKPDTDFKCKKFRGEVSNVSIPDIESIMLSVVKKSKKSVLLAILMILLDSVVGVSMPQQPE